MGYVAKGTLPGYDVKTAADYLQSFNSGWPLLKQHMTGNYSAPVAHGLGYPPFHILASTTVPGAVDEFSDAYGVDSSFLQRTSGSGGPRYYIFRLDLTTDYTAPIIQTATDVSAKNDGYVFKMTKEGKSTDSTDMRDYSLHSNTKSPAVHLVKHGKMAVVGLYWKATIAHGLGYVPTAFPFIKPNANNAGLDNNRYTMVPPPVGVSYMYYEVDATNVYVYADIFFFDLAIPDYSVVVLKDPFQKEVINVSFP